MHRRFKVCTGARYFGGFIGTDKFKRGWLKDRESKLKNIRMITETAGEYLQDSSTVVVFVIQSEWIFLQCVTKDKGHAFAGVEKLLWETFLNRLLFGKLKCLPQIVLTLSTMTVKKSILSLLIPVTSANKKYISLICTISNLIGSVTGANTFSTADHIMALKEERPDGQKNPG